MSMTLHDLVGQSLMLSFSGPSVTPELLNALRAMRACGVILFANNISTPDALYELNQRLQSEAAALGLPPLLIAIDQEGGNVTRLPAPFTTVPSQMAQAATGDPATAYECAAITGRQLRAFGINTDFAPVLDVNNNPANPVIGVRSFGSDLDVVVAFGQAALRGYRDTGVIATVKHFPGHGDTTIDSHLGLPTLDYPRARLEALELAPFVAAFAAGAPALMTAHIVFQALDTLPATLSQAILTDLLRAELGYDGLVFTDALEMRAIADSYGPFEAALLSKAAGADVLLPLGPLDEQVAAGRALLAAVQDGRLSHESFAATARRLDMLRAAYGISHALPPFEPPAPELRSAALDLARRSVTLVRDQGALPLRPELRLALIDCLLPRGSNADEALERADLLRALITAICPATTSLTVRPTPTDDELAQALALTADCDAVLLVTRSALLIEAQARLAQSLARTGRPLIHVAARNPYDATLLPEATATLLTYGDPELSLEALADVLAGRVAATGAPPADLAHALGRSA
jgi:beta-N-acetylhexosaminidase